MRFPRRTGLLPAAGLTLLAAACAGRPVRSSLAADPTNRDRDLIVLLPDPESGAVGRATVTNPSGKADLAGARAATYVPSNQAPSPVTTLSEAEVREAFGNVFDTLPQAPQHFTLNFRFDSDELTPESQAMVQEILQTVKTRKLPDVLVLGHTDRAGPAATNIALGLKRATIIRKLLVDSGLAPSLIEIDSHGEADPIVPTTDGVAEPRNRRVEITVR
jgi:outer membrane protein OmpA-like peptidoglycan-associated protein